MTALAGIDDYEALTGQDLTSADTSRLSLLLEWASDELLASAHGQTIVSAEHEAETIYNYGGRFWFPQRPVTAVSSVTIAGVVLDPEDYRWTPGGQGLPAQLIRRVDGYDARWREPEAIVDYVAGWDEVPGPLKAVVCTMAKRCYQGSSMGEFTSATPSGALGSSFPPSATEDLPPRMTPALERIVDRWTEVHAPQSVEVGR